MTNEDGLILSSVLNFSVYCALPESFGVSNDHEVLIPDGLHDGFDGLVAGADLSAAFVLNKYINDQIDNESPAELGEPVHFKVEPIDQIPDFWITSLLVVIWREFWTLVTPFLIHFHKMSIAFILMSKHIIQHRMI